ncbi:TIGR00374 family protein [Rhodobacteraceae bacterium WD3A24]|nr:TIGR00374 family protein [Rhodobacteraceae bacterium WD3A24]
MLLLGGLFVGLTALGLWAVQDALGGTIRFDARIFSARMIASVGALMALYLLADGLRLYFTLRALGETIAPGAMLRLVFINIFFSNITPLATGGGFAQVWYLRAHGVGVGRAMAATTIRTVLAVIVIFTLAPLALLSLPELAGHPILGRISEAVALLILAYLAGFAVVLFRAGWLIAPIARLIGLGARIGLIGPERRDRWQEQVSAELRDFSLSFRTYLGGPRRQVAASMLFTLVFLVSLFSFPALILTNLGHDVGYIDTTGKLVVVTFIMYFAPTPGSAGISEGVFAGLFAGQVPSGQLLLVIVAWRFATIYFGMLIGLILTQIEIARIGRRG